MKNIRLENYVCYLQNLVGLPVFSCFSPTKISRFMLMNGYCHLQFTPPARRYAGSGKRRRYRGYPHKGKPVHRVGEDLGNAEQRTKQDTTILTLLIVYTVKIRCVTLNNCSKKSTETFSIN